jgi:hypothetical protein
MSTVMEEPAVKPGKAKKETAPRAATPKLVCNVTGVTRYTNATYLANKAKKLGTTVEAYINHYVNRGVAKMLREGKTVAEIRSILGVEHLSSPLINTSEDTILKYNGKQKQNK